jgi:hypothetical protein
MNLSEALLEGNQNCLIIMPAPQWQRSEERRHLQLHAFAPSSSNSFPPTPLVEGQLIKDRTVMSKKKKS